MVPEAASMVYSYSRKLWWNSISYSARPSSWSNSALTKLTPEELRPACSSAICLARSLVIRPEEEAFLLEEVLVAPLLEEGR